MSAVAAALQHVHAESWGFVLASVARSVRDLDLAEDAVQDAFLAALDTWPRDGIPATPAAWLITAARRRAIDRLRREATLGRKLPLLIVPGEETGRLEDLAETAEVIPDERLRLIFTCCHPAIGLEGRVALTLRLVCGLTTPEIARLFVVPEATMAARITRAKKKIAAAGIAYRVPEAAELPDRLPSVLQAVYLVFTEGHSAGAGDRLIRAELTGRAIALAEVLAQLLPNEPEVIGLLALMQLAQARSVTRLDPHGRFVPLERQDRAGWDRAAIGAAVALVERALRLGQGRQPGPFALQAAIGALHAEAPSYAATDWPQILALYDVLLAVTPTPIVALNRSVAVAMVAGLGAALAIVEEIAATGALADYPFLEATRADYLRRLGRNHEARRAYELAHHRTANAIEQDYLRRRTAELK